MCLGHLPACRLTALAQMPDNETDQGSVHSVTFISVLIVRWEANLTLDLFGLTIQPKDPGAPGMLVLLCPLVVSGYMMCCGRPGMLRRACPLRGRSGSMCVEAHYLATEAAAGRAEKEDIPRISKKQRISRLIEDKTFLGRPSV